MGNITLSLTKDLQSVVDRAVEIGDFVDGTAFIESLIRDHRAQKLGVLHAALDQGERSGISARNFDEIVADARERFRSRAT